MEANEVPQTEKPAPVLTPEAADIAENKDLAALSYVWILSLVVHFSAGHSPFARFHCRQGLVLFALSIAVSFIPVVGTVLLLAILALSVLGFLNAAQGLKKDLPFIGPIARADLHEFNQHMGDVLQKVRKLWKHKPKTKTESPAKPASVVTPVPVPTPASQPAAPVVPAPTPVPPADQTPPPVPAKEPPVPPFTPLS